MFAIKVAKRIGYLSFQGESALLNKFDIQAVYFTKSILIFNHR